METNNEKVFYVAADAAPCGRREYLAPHIEVIKAEACQLMEPSVRANGATWENGGESELEFLDYTESASGARRRNIWDAPTGVFDE